MDKLKSSAYNFLLPQADQSYILYNSASGNAARLDNPTGRAVAWLLQEPNQDDVLGKNLAELKDGLVRDSFLVLDSFDELEALRKRHQEGRSAVGGLNLTVAVTLACNFRCSYCSQDRELHHMSLQTADELLQFVKRVLPDNTHLSVTWYGGEPLLNKPILNHLSRSFLTICDEKHCSYDAFMITNGYRLNKATVEDLTELKIRDFQITVDGDRNVHNRNRPLRGGQPTYDVILKNISEILPHTESIALRINVLRSTVQAAIETYRKFRQLAKHHSNLQVYLARVFPTGADSVSADDILSIDEFANLVEEIACGVRTDFVPPPMENVCGADRADSFVVDPAGNLFKCWNSVGRGDEPVGNVANYAPTPNKWVEFDPTEDEECRQCRFLPICLGGCLDTRFTGGSGERDCCNEKFVLQNRLENWARVVGREAQTPTEVVS
jgi:uncharacterized protein